MATFVLLFSADPVVFLSSSWVRRASHTRYYKSPGLDSFHVVSGRDYTSDLWDCTSYLCLLLRQCFWGKLKLIQTFDQSWFGSDHLSAVYAFRCNSSYKINYISIGSFSVEWKLGLEFSFLCSTIGRPSKPFNKSVKKANHIKSFSGHWWFPELERVCMHLWYYPLFSPFIFMSLLFLSSFCYFHPPAFVQNESLMSCYSFSLCFLGGFGSRRNVPRLEVLFQQPLTYTRSELGASHSVGLDGSTY